MKTMVKRHKLVVEITDMSGHDTTRDLTRVIKDAIENGLDSGAHNGDGDYVNVRVKSFVRVLAYERRKARKGVDWDRVAEMGAKMQVEQIASLRRSVDDHQARLKNAITWRGVLRTVLFLLSGGRW